jgi:hypothetical protein
MSVKIRPRRGTAAAWTAANPTLDTAEIGLETDTRKIKFGDAATAWNTLAYHNTDSVPESGAPTNKYFTDARARAAFSATAPVALSAGGVISMPKSTAGVDGYLSSADFTSFAAKESVLSFTAPLVRTVNTVAPDFTAQWTWTANGIAATPTDRIQLSNTTAATSSVLQYSPAARLTAQSWDNVAASSKAVDFRLYIAALSTSGGGGTLNIDTSVGGAAFANKITVGSNSGNVTLVGGLASSSNITAGSGSAFTWSGLSQMLAPSDGVIRLTNSAQNAFTRLQFGGTTSSFPALARSGTTLQAKLADASGDCAFTCGNVGFNGSAATGKSSAYTFSNQTALRTINVSTATLTDALNCLAAIVADLKTVGLFA